MVIVAGSANSEIAQIVKGGSTLTHFHIGRNIILFGYHIHHFYFGILLMGIAGWLAIAGRTDISKEKLALIYGAGLGLLMDEIGLLLTWGDYASTLSYLLGVFLLGIIFSLIYFPRFWISFHDNISWARYPLSLLNNASERIINLAERFIASDSEDK
ncbi:hypothetical protein KGY72_02530 [Candidatus Bipolaricaulota bacterium]|nr:hypothetical protein [Candidatus Bipolaricaulota bacterium]MBS3792691.1 hypothetical protein [Candidatus Bipolaricaulota bacterium]